MTGKCNWRLQRYSYPTPGTHGTILQQILKSLILSRHHRYHVKKRARITYILSYHHSPCPVNTSPCQVQSALLIVTPIVDGLIIQNSVRSKGSSFFLSLRGANSPHCVTTLCFAFGLNFCSLKVHNPPFFFTYCNDEALCHFQNHIHIHSKTSRLDVLLLAISIVSVKRCRIAMDCVCFSADRASSVTTRNGIRVFDGRSSKVMALTAALAYFSYSGFGVRFYDFGG